MAILFYVYKYKSPSDKIQVYFFGGLDLWEYIMANYGTLSNKRA